MFLTGIAGYGYPSRVQLPAKERKVKQVAPKISKGCEKHQRLFISNNHLKIMV